MEVSSILATGSNNWTQSFVLIIKVSDDDCKEMSLRVTHCHHRAKLTASVRLDKLERYVLGQRLLKFLIKHVTSATGTEINDTLLSASYNTVTVNCCLKGLDSLESFTERVMTIVH